MTIQDPRKQHRKDSSTRPLSVTKARQQKYLDRVAEGASMADAIAYAGVSQGSPWQWRNRTPGFKEAEALARLAGQRDREYPRCQLSAETRESYFSFDYEEPINPPHLLKVMDFINSLEKGQFGLILLPPEHAKTSLGEDWLTCSIADDPECRGVVVSKSLGEAQKRLLRVQSRMEDIDFYKDFIATWGPFKPEARGPRPWAATKMTIRRKTPRQRDYSLQAIGIGGGIQGQRIDRALLDDIADDQNYGEYENHARYIRQSVNTRLGKTGIGLMIGTRQDEMDIYKYLMDEGFFDATLVLPARFPDRSTLWPDRYSDDDYSRMETKAGPRIWSLTYQQQNVVSEGQAFPLPLLESCYDNTIPIQSVPKGCRVVVGIDPAAAGFTAGFVMAVDPQTKLRYVIDCWNEKNLTGDGGDRLPGLIQFIVTLVETYRARVCVLEENSAWTLLSSSLTLRNSLTELGCQLVRIKSGRNENDDLAIAQLSALFANELIVIPHQGASYQVTREWIKQMVAWHPGNKKLIRDLVKAFQFAELGIRNVLTSTQVVEVKDHTMPEYLRNQQMSIPL